MARYYRRPRGTGEQLRRDLIDTHKARVDVNFQNFNFARLLALLLFSDILIYCYRHRHDFYFMLPRF